MEVFLRKEAEIPGAHKIGAAISGPRIAGGLITDIRLFLNWRFSLSKVSSILGSMFGRVIMGYEIKDLRPFHPGKARSTVILQLHMLSQQNAGGYGLQAHLRDRPS